MAYAYSFDNLGKTYEILEMDALSWITFRLHEMEKNGEIEKQNEALKQRVLAAVDRPKKVEGIEKTTHPRVFEHDLTVTVPYDIRDYDGNIIHYAGTSINPLKYVLPTRTLLLFDGDDNTQVAWALNEQNSRKKLVKLVLVNGSIAELSRSHNVRVYFDQAGILTKKFGIKQVPAIVEQQGNKLIITEVKV